MIDIIVVILLIVLHFISDFLLQSDKIATTKSKSNKSLFTHIFIYSLPFLTFGLQFAVMTGLMHLCVDYVTSRVTSRLYKKGEIHWFFVVIGFDQMLHMLSLMLLYVYLF